jgi:PAS domain S-box-containing protein
MTLRWKLLLPLFLISGVLGVYLYAVLIPNSEASAEAQRLEAVERHLDTVVEAMIPLLLGSQLDILHENLTALQANNRDWVALRLGDGQGRQLYPLKPMTLAPAGTKVGDRHYLARKISYIGMDLGTLALEIDLAPALARDREEHKHHTYVLISLVLFVAVTLLLALELLIKRPIGMLARAAEALAQRQYTYPLPPARDDEVGSLIKSFARMASDIQAYQNELEMHRKHLETLVEARTRDLESTTRQLRETQYAMDHAGFGIHWVEIETGRLLYVNEYACQMLGYSREELLRMSVPDFDPGFAHGRFAEQTRELQLKGLGRVEAFQRRKDGQAIPVEITFYHQPADDRHPARFITFITDITERKLAETQLRQARDVAEAANRAKSTFLANMSHELRTPMNAIMGMTALALRLAQDPKLRDHLGKIEQASKRLLGIINAILEISKLEAERLTLENLEFKFNEVLDSLMSLIGNKAAEKGLKIITDLPSGLLDTTFVGDPLRLGQIFLNLASNAVKFTDNGSISLRIRLAEDNPDNVLLRCEVQDSGIGISADDRQRLFNAFEQADGSMTRKYGGAGLGLAISKRLVQMMGGEIGVESEPGQGSTFWFTVRLGKPADTGASPLKGAEP